VASGEGNGGSSSGWLTLADVERLHLERTLAATMQNKSLAAKLLGIDRSVLRRKLQRYGLTGAEPAASEGADADGDAEPT
jgi:DNA-binding protein Fis